MTKVYVYQPPWKNLYGWLIEVSESSAVRQMQFWVVEKGRSIKIQPIYFFSDDDLTEPEKGMITYIDGVLRYHRDDRMHTT